MLNFCVVSCNNDNKDANDSGVTVRNAAAADKKPVNNMMIHG